MLLHQKWTFRHIVKYQSSRVLSLDGTWADLIVYGHWFSITITKAAPPTTAGGASSHWGTWTISTWSFRAHPHGSPGQPSVKRRELWNKVTSALLQGGWGNCIFIVKLYYCTGCLLCSRSCCPRSSSHALHPDPSDGLTCSASCLWLPCGVRAWKRVFSLPCLCDPCRGGQPGKNEGALLCGLIQNSLGSAQSQDCLCEEQDAVSFLLARHQTGYV